MSQYKHLEQRFLQAIPGLCSIDWLQLPGAAPDMPSACMVRFDVDAFQPRAFAVAGLACPVNVAGSVVKRQAEFFFGRLAARQALAALGCWEADVPIGASREPVWPRGIIGSISHSGGFAAAVTVPEGARRGIGIDIESVVDDAVQPDLLATAVSQQEVELLRDTGLPFNIALTTVFSAKESLFKAAFNQVGHYFDFPAARLRRLDLTTGQLLFEIAEDLCEALRPGTLCRLDFRLLAAGIVLTSCVC